MALLSGRTLIDFVQGQAVLELSLANPLLLTCERE